MTLASRAPALRELDGREASAHILIVDDEAFIRNAFQLYFQSIGYRVSIAEGGETALAIFEKTQEPVDVVLLDLVMPGIPGIKLLQKMKDIDESVEVIIATGCGSMNSAVEALRFGAYDYITKPILNFDEDLLRVVRGALATRFGRLLQKTAVEAQGEFESPAAALNDEFYRSLECLARRIEAEPSVAIETVGRFLEKELGVLAGVALSEKDGGVQCIASWGAAVEVDGTALSSDARVWLEAVEVHRGWKLIRAADRTFPWLEPSAKGVSLEALRIPMRSSLSPASPRSMDLLLFRAPGGQRSHAPPDVGLLQLVLAQALDLGCL